MPRTGAATVQAGRPSAVVCRTSTIGSRNAAGEENGTTGATGAIGSMRRSACAAIVEDGFTPGFAEIAGTRTQNRLRIRAGQHAQLRRGR